MDGPDTPPPTDVVRRTAPSSTDGRGGPRSHGLSPTVSGFKVSAPPGYTVEGELGRGGMGVVYRGLHVSLNRPVAIKTVRGADTNDPVAVARFWAEAELVAAIDHPHVVRVYDFGMHLGSPFLAMEYLPGESLGVRLHAGPLPPAEAAVLVAKVAAGVAAAHDQGIVHRDLKPGNVLFDEQGEPKVTDFGVAKRGGAADLTRTGTLVGTPSYMAPEQADGRTRFVGPPADVWALGAILYECLTGRRAFEGDDAGVVIQKVLTQEPPSVRGRDKELPRDLDTICKKCLTKEPDRRYPTARELADDLDRFTRGEPITARAAGRLERSVRWARRKPTLAAAYALSALAAVLFGLAGGAVWLWMEADAAHADAVAARDDLSGRNAELRAARDALDHISYARTLQLAYQEYRDDRVARAGVLLDTCRADLRGWEWRHLDRLRRAERVVYRGHDQAVFGLAVTPDGRFAATGGHGPYLRVWEVETGRDVLRVAAHGAVVQSVAVSRCGTRVATGSNDGSVRVWDAKTGDPVATVPVSATLVRGLAFLPDGDRVAAAAYDGTAGVWDVKTGRRVCAFVGHDQEVMALAVSPDGRTVVTAALDRTARVWDAETGAIRRVLRGHRGPVTSVGFFADGRVVTGSGDTTVRVWNPDTGKVLVELDGHRNWVMAVAASPDGKRVASGSGDHTLKVWSVEREEELFTLRGHTAVVLGVAFTPAGDRLVSIGEDRTARVWDARTGPEDLTLHGHADELRAAAISPAGDLVLTGGEEGAARLWDATTGEVVRRIPGPVLAATFLPDGGLLTGGPGGAAVWAATGRPVRTLGERLGGVRAVAVTADGRTALTAGDDGTARVWDVATGRPGPVLTGHAGPVHGVAVTPDGDLAVTAGSDGTVRVWRVRSGALERTLSADAGAVNGVAVIPGTPDAVTAHEDGSLVVWDVRAGERRRTLRGHSGPVFAVAALPDGSRLLTGGSDCRLRVWDAASGEELLHLRGHGLAIRSVAVSAAGPGGVRVATAGRDRVGRVWDTAAER